MRDPLQIFDEDLGIRSEVVEDQQSPPSDSKQRLKMAMTVAQWVMCLVVLLLLQVVVVVSKVMRVCTWTDVRDGALIFFGLKTLPAETRKSK